MDQSFIALCHRLYIFILKFLATYAMKSVTLGHDSHQASADLSPSHSAASASSSLPMAQEITPPRRMQTLQPDPAGNYKEVQEMGDLGISSAPSKAEEASVSAIGSQDQPPKNGEHKLYSRGDGCKRQAGRKVGLSSAFIIKTLYFGRYSTDREVALMMIMAYLPYMLAKVQIRESQREVALMMIMAYLPYMLAKVQIRESQRLISVDFLKVDELIFILAAFESQWDSKSFLLWHCHVTLHIA
ncbi:hypothetical protein DITRI_Ditri06bG0160800 [Diplodiscus trichospermus]